MNRRIIFIPNDGSYIEICGHRITWTGGWEEFLEYLKRCDLAMEKDTPKKLIETILYEDEHHFVKGYKCPRCGDYKTSLLEKYCSECGQKLKEWM